MKEQRKCIFVSDVHFRGTERANGEAFLSFLKFIRPHTSQLFLVGDVLDFWVGHRSSPGSLDPLFEALQSFIEQGSTIHWFTGNHDPVAPRVLTSMPVNIHTQGKRFMLYGKDVWLEHGDLTRLVNPATRLLCAAVRQSALQKVARLVPLKWSWSLSGRYSDQAATYANPIETQRFESSLTAKAEMGIDLVIIGHHHRACVRRFTGADNVTLTWSVLGDWVNQFTFGTLGEEFRLNRYCPSTQRVTRIPFGDHCPPASD